MVAGTVALIGGGTLHNLRKAATTNVSGTIQREEKGVLQKFADNLLKGTSLFGGARGDSAKKLAANKTTKMSGAPLSLPLFFEANRGQTDGQSLLESLSRCDRNCLNEIFLLHLEAMR
jgi:hypothetical protein